jgi:hypothetical protein
MTPEQYKETFQYDAKKGKSYTEQNGAMAESSDKASTLLCVWEIWSQADNRVFHVCDGEDGFCRPPDSPDWTGKRWYPFFLLAWNEIDGGFYPLSDIEMTDKLVKEYNEQREDFVRDRRECLPITIIRKGGSLTDADVKNISNAKGGDKVLVEGVGGQPISNDVWNGQMGTLDPRTTTPPPPATTWSGSSAGRTPPPARSPRPRPSARRRCCPPRSRAATATGATRWKTC